MSNFVNKETILSLAKRMTNHLQKGRGYIHVTNFCMCNCGLRKKFRHSTLLAWINKIDDGPLFVSPSTVDASAAIH